MKNLENLKKQDLKLICRNEQKLIKGGGGPESYYVPYNTDGTGGVAYGPEGDQYYTPGDVIIYGGSPGNMEQSEFRQAISFGLALGGGGSAMGGFHGAALGFCAGFLLGLWDAMIN